MALATLNGFDVVSARITLPLSGAWHADVIVDSAKAPTGAALLVLDGGLRLTGRTTRSDAYLETSYLRMTAGADGMRRTARPKFYTSGTVGVVLRDLLSTAGETLATSSAADVLGATLPAWATIAQPVGAALAVLLARGGPAGATWRHLPDGTLWVGVETWPDSGMVDGTDFVQVDSHPHEDRVELGVETLHLLPGTLLQGRRVNTVEHDLQDGRVRTSAMLQAG
jgi:hypothetical protein